MRSLDLSLASALSTDLFRAKTTNYPRDLENFATFRGLKNLKEHGVVMPKQTQLAIAEQQSSATAVSAFYATIAAVGTLGIAILIISANVAYAVAH